MSNPLDMSEKVVIVTGGTKGVGRGIAETFLAAGATVYVCGRNEPDSLPSVDAKQAAFRAVDVRDYEQIRSFVDAVIAESGRLDVLVNNAGGSPAADAATASPRFSESIVRLNLLAPLNLAQVANAVMQKQPDGGVIVNIASVSATRPSPSTAAYGAAKSGLISLTTSLAVEWGPKVRVNAVTAGLIRTEQSHLHYGDEAGLQAVANTIPLRRMAEPADIGNACLFLASELASYISGAALLVHGGGERPAFMDAANAEKP